MVHVGRRSAMIDVMTDFLSILDQAVVEVEEHVHAGGWDRGPALFAFVGAGQFSVDEPDTAARLGIDTMPAGALVPIEQEDLPDQPLDEVLAGLQWPAHIAGCAVTQEIVILPPSAEADLDPDDPAAAARAAEHPERREARLAVGVLRDGSSAAMLRMRRLAGENAKDDATDGAGVEDDRVTGPDLAPNLVEALLATLA